MRGGIRTGTISGWESSCELLRQFPKRRLIRVGSFGYSVSTTLTVAEYWILSKAHKLLKTATRSLTVSLALKFIYVIAGFGLIIGKCC